MSVTLGPKGVALKLTRTPIYLQEIWKLSARKFCFLHVAASTRCTYSKARDLDPINLRNEGQ